MNTSAPQILGPRTDPLRARTGHHIKPPAYVELLSVRLAAIRAEAAK
jgi:hypothetical protein